MAPFWQFTCHFFNLYGQGTFVVQEKSKKMFSKGGLTVIGVGIVLVAVVKAITVYQNNDLEPMQQVQAGGGVQEPVVYPYGRRGILVLDLDGDGIETIGVRKNILFDHDGNRVKIGTGWVKSDDGLLVWDRNGNGQIDSGAELFGVDYIKADGTHAKNGFDALRDLDSNGDGVFDGNDPHFSSVRVWRGIDRKINNSDPDTLFLAKEWLTLDELDIVSISLNSSPQTIELVGDSLQTAASVYARKDNSAGTIGAVDLAGNPFYRKFLDRIPLTEAAKRIPDMHGAGAVRDLREAASLSRELAVKVKEYMHLSTERGRLVQVDDLLDAWMATSTMKSGTERAEQLGYQLIYVGPGVSIADYESFVMHGVGAPHASEAGFPSVPEAKREKFEALKTKQRSLAHLIGVLEIFNGRAFLDLDFEPDAVFTGAGERLMIREGPPSVSGADVEGYSGMMPRRVYVTIESGQLDLLESSLSDLKKSVQQGLAP